MNTNEKARAAASPAERALTETTAGSASFSTLKCITDSGQMQGRIATLLPRGEGNAIPTRELMALAGYGTVRQLQKQIEAERAAGALILSSSTGGYYLPADGEDGRAEIIRYERTLRRRAVNTLRPLKTARRALRVIGGQTRIEEVDTDG